MQVNYVWYTRSFTHDWMVQSPIFCPVGPESTFLSGFRFCNSNNWVQHFAKTLQIRIDIRFIHKNSGWSGVRFLYLKSTLVNKTSIWTILRRPSPVISLVFCNFSKIIQLSKVEHWWLGNWRHHMFSFISRL